MGIELTNGDLWGIRLRGKRGFSDFPFTKADVFKRGIQKKSAAEWNPDFHISIYSWLTSEMEWNGICFHFWCFSCFPIRSSDSTFDVAARPGQPLASPAQKRWCWSSYGSFASPVPKILSWPETGGRYSLVGGLELEFYFSIYWEEESQLTNFFERGWNHQPVTQVLPLFVQLVDTLW